MNLKKTFLERLREFMKDGWDYEEASKNGSSQKEQESSYQNKTTFSTKKQS